VRVADEFDERKAVQRLPCDGRRRDRNRERDPDPCFAHREDASLRRDEQPDGEREEPERHRVLRFHGEARDHADP
jgi:hypothetical protein